MTEPAATAKELQARMNDYAPVAARWFNARLAEPSQVVGHSVSGSTFRAYRTKRYTPSSLFRTWAWQALQSSEAWKRVQKSESREEFASIHEDLSQSLICHWTRYESSGIINYGQSCKLLNLFLKHVALWEDLDDGTRSRLIQFTHVPLDQFTLKHISSIARGDLLRDSNWTMGYVKDKITYDCLQHTIHRALGEAYPPIYYDIYAWNQEHCKVIHVDSKKYKGGQFNLMERPQFRTRASSRTR